jgi:hypothetical protein
MSMKHVISVSGGKDSTAFNKELQERNCADCRIHEANRTESVIAWSRTTRGWRQFDLLADLTESTACASAYGLCE